MPSITSYRLLEACREPGCPVCRLEQQGVERYLDNQLYENVNSPGWRDHLRLSYGFCGEHAWLAVNKRLGDALGFSIIYHDIVNNLLRSLNEDAGSARTARRRGGVPRQGSGYLRKRIAGLLAALAPRKPCPACEHRAGLTRDVLSALVEGLARPEMTEALQSSEGLCISHLQLALGTVNDESAFETLLAIQRRKWENLKTELAEFIRKSDYHVIQQGFGSEGNAWLRAISLIAGNPKER